MIVSHVIQWFVVKGISKQKDVILLVRLVDDTLEGYFIQVLTHLNNDFSPTSPIGTFLTAVIPYAWPLINPSSVRCKLSPGDPG